MNDLIRMKKLAGILTEGVMAVPGMGVDEPQVAHQDPTMNMQGVSESSELDDVIQQKIARAQELMDSMVDPHKAADLIYTELEQDGHSIQDIEQILDAVAAEMDGEFTLGAADNTETDEGGICSACNGSGEGQYDGTTCSSCGGSGEEHSNHDQDDYDGPEYEPDEMYEEEVDEAFDLNNGYDDITFMKPGDFFPDGADSPVTSHTGAAGARQGDNPEQKKVAVAETHKELVYNYRKFLKESVKNK